MCYLGFCWSCHQVLGEGVSCLSVISLLSSLFHSLQHFLSLPLLLSLSLPLFLCVTLRGPYFFLLPQLPNCMHTQGHTWLSHGRQWMLTEEQKIGNNNQHCNPFCPPPSPLPSSLVLSLTSFFSFFFQERKFDQILSGPSDTPTTTTVSTTEIHLQAAYHMDHPINYNEDIRDYSHVLDKPMKVRKSKNKKLCCVIS